MHYILPQPQKIPDFLRKLFTVKNYYGTLLILMGFLVFSDVSVGQINPTTNTNTNTVGNTTTITINGTGTNYTFTVPLGVTQVSVQAWGGGGATRGTGNRWGGGGGGAYAGSTLTNLIAGQTYTVTVGAGGITTGNPAGSGGSSIFGANVVVAAGGSGGADNNGGAGGTVGNSTGTIRFAGGSGGNRGSNNNGGGGGGGSATSSANGGNGAVGTTTGTGVGGTGQGNGGNGGTGNNTSGSNGVAPGGGGGGKGDGTGGTPGLGANGRVIITYTTCSPFIGTPVFSLGTTSSRCVGAGAVTYSATSANATGIVYSLNAASLSGGNTINSATGEVTYDPTFVGTSIVTATASGCAGPLTATHTVTVNANVGTVSFTLGATSQRCSAAGTVTYTATAANTTGITYSLDATSLTAGNSINPNTGAVTYVSTWSGTSTITATAAGCNGPTQASHVAVTGTLFANNDAITTIGGVPFAFNVLTNDVSCGPVTVSIVTQPANGLVQVGSNGQMVYVSNATFSGMDEFIYKVCSNATGECKEAKVMVLVQEVLDNACFEANQEKIYFLPYPENNTQLRQSLLSAGSANELTTQARTVISISFPYPGTVLNYDHWEDGYEANISDPQQSTTQIWGDGNLSNGIAPGYPTDIIPAGGIVTLDNTFLWNRPTTTIVYDGKDKLYSSANIAVSKVTGDGGLSGTINLFDVQNVKTTVTDISRYGNFFVLPFGENITAGPTTAFRYTGLFARALENGTIISLDYDGNGTVDVTSPTLNEGEVWFYNGTGSSPGVVGDVNNANDLKAGARVSANKDFGVDIVFGGIDNYGTRNIPILPVRFIGNTYYSSVYSTNVDAPARAYFVNPTTNPITINWTRIAGSPLTGSFTVPANNGLATFNMNVASGTKFASAGGEAYTAVVVVDADETSATYDWAFVMIPERRLTNYAAVAWAPGSSNGTANYNPVWVTPTANTTIYVKYNGNLTSGTNQSPCGAFFDVSFPVTALQSQLIFGINNDNSGMAVFTCNDVPISAVWGERPFDNTPTATPAIDVGYTMEPKCLAKYVFATDDRRITGQNTPININVAANDAGYLVTINPTSVALLGQPANGTAVVNPDGTVTYTPNIGFTGEDQFDYQICGQSPDNFICDIATVFIKVPCILLEGNSVISGSVYADNNLNGASNAGEPGIGGIGVQLYDDLNNNDQLDPGEPLLQTQTSSSTVNPGYYQFNIPQLTYRDNFTTSGIANGSNGTVAWTSSPWTEILETNGFGTANISITAASGLIIQGNGAATQVGAQRTANLTGAGLTTTELSYSFNKNGFSGTVNDWVEVQVGPAPTGPWTTLVRYNGTAAASGTATWVIPASAISATTTIRFIESTDAGFSTGERVLFDNVQIRYVTQKKYIVKLTDPIADNWKQTSAPAAYSISFSNFNDANCSSSFGLAKADLAITKVVDIAKPNVGQNVTFTITATNNGPTNGSGVTVTDVIPTGYSVVSVTPSTGSWTAPTWTIGDFANEASATLIVVATINNVGSPYLNTATITGNEFDFNLANNTSSAIVNPLPIAGSGINNAINPGGLVQVPVLPNNFTNLSVSSVPPNEIIQSIRITAFPVGATSIVINGTPYTSGNFPVGGVIVNTDVNGNPAPGAITIDPAADGPTSITIPFKAIDNGGDESSNTGTAVLNFGCITYRSSKNGLWNDVSVWQIQSFDGNWLSAPSTPIQRSQVLIFDSVRQNVDFIVEECPLVLQPFNINEPSRKSKLEIEPDITLGFNGGNDGNAYFNSRPVVVRSTEVGTGAIGTMLSNSKTSGDDNITLERYIPGTKRRWNLLTFGVTSSTATFRDGWGGGSRIRVDSSQNSHDGKPFGSPPIANPFNVPFPVPNDFVAGDGTIITGHSHTDPAVANAQGFDWWPELIIRQGSKFWIDKPNGTKQEITAGRLVTTPSSIRPYRPGQLSDFDTSRGTGWISQSSLNTNYRNFGVSIANTNLDSAEQGYMLYTRGDREVLENWFNSTTLRPTGQIKKLEVTVPIVPKPAVGTSLTPFGNPYPAPIDFEKLASGANSNVIENRFYYWDSNLYGTQGNGAWRTVTQIAPGDWIAAPTPTVPPIPVVPSIEGKKVQFISSSQAILLEGKSAGNQNVSVTEAMKVDIKTVDEIPFEVEPASGLKPGILYTNFNARNSTNNLSLMDGVAVLVGYGFKSETTDASDIKKIFSFTDPGTSLSLVRDGLRLGIEAYPEPETESVFYLRTTGLEKGNYALTFGVRDLYRDGREIFLKDNFLRSETVISAINSSQYDFEVTDDPMSLQPSRFEIVFKQGTVLPVTFTSVNAVEQQKNINVTWGIATEEKMSHYEVEHSRNGTEFAKAVKVDAKNVSPASYEWLHILPGTGTHFYRVRAYNLEGRNLTTRVVKVTIGSGSPAFQVFPTVVSAGNRQVTMQLTSMEKGLYNYQISDMSGKVIQTGKIEHNGGSVSMLLQLPPALSAGKYNVRLIGASGSFIEPIVKD